MSSLRPQRETQALDRGFVPTERCWVSSTFLPCTTLPSTTIRQNTLFRGFSHSAALGVDPSLTQCEGRQALCWGTGLFLAAGELTATPSNCISICIIHWHWISSLWAWVYRIKKKKYLCISSLSFIFSPATILQAIGFMPGQIHFICSSLWAESALFHSFLCVLRNSGLTQLEQAFPLADCKAHTLDPELKAKWTKWHTWKGLWRDMGQLCARSDSHL